MTEKQIESKFKKLKEGYEGGYFIYLPMSDDLYLRKCYECKCQIKSQLTIRIAKKLSIVEERLYKRVSYCPKCFFEKIQPALKLGVEIF